MQETGQTCEHVRTYASTLNTWTCQAHQERKHVSKRALIARKQASIPRTWARKHAKLTSTEVRQVRVLVDSLIAHVNYAVSFSRWAVLYCSIYLRIALKMKKSSMENFIFCAMTSILSLILLLTPQRSDKDNYTVMVSQSPLDQFHLVNMKVLIRAIDHLPRSEICKMKKYWSWDFWAVL